jgi:hypothetical protein
VTIKAGATTTASLEARVAEAHRRASLILMVIAASIVLYIAIALYVISLRQPRGLTQQTFLGFYAAAAFLAFGSIFYRRAQMRRIRLEVVAGLRGINGLVKHFFQVTVVTLAMADVIGLLALLVSFFGGDHNDIVRLGVVAIVIALFAYPRRQSWQQAVAYFAATMPGID